MGLRSRQSVGGRGGEAGGRGCTFTKCFTLQGPVFRPWDTREVSTMAKLCVLWQLSHGKQTELDFFLFSLKVFGSLGLIRVG